jgi:ABC-2 type transport system permease protein
MIAVELRKLVRRPRTWVAIGLLDLLPTIVAILVAVTNIGPRPGQGPAFLSAVLSEGSLFSVAALAIVLPLFLPVAVAVVSGDSIAGEAQSGMLRYLLARPAGRTRLLVAKLVAVFVFVIVAVIVVAGTGYLVGSLLLGDQPVTATTSISSVSGTTLTASQIAVRTALSIGYVALSMIGVAAMALFLSTLTDSPLSASLGALAFLIGSSLLLTLDAAHALQPYLPTRYWLSFVDLFRDPIHWYNVERGVAIQLVYVAVLLGAAWANFMTKDITS